MRKIDGRRGRVPDSSQMFNPTNFWSSLKLWIASSSAPVWVGAFAPVIYTIVTGRPLKVPGRAAHAPKQSEDVARDALLATNSPYLGVTLVKIVGKVGFENLQ